MAYSQENINKTILLVEDDPVITMTEEIILKKNGFQVITADTGEKALEIVYKNNRIDLILMDINLGKGIDGTETACIILDKYDLPIVFLSSHTEKEIVEKTEGITSYGYIVKNTGETVLIASIKMAFRLYEAKLREKEKEISLIESENKFRTLVDKAGQMLFLHDLNGDIIDVNQEAITQTGYSRKELLNMNVSDIDPDAEKRQDHENIWNNKKLNKNYIFQVRHRRKDGSIYPAEVHGAKIIITNKPYILGLAMDISREKKTEEQISRLNKILHSMIHFHQLILSEKNKEKMMGQICEFLNKIHGYYHSWIILFDKNMNFQDSFQSGLDTKFQNILKIFQSGKQTKCVKMALSAKHDIVIQNPETFCKSCPLADTYHGKGALILKLSFENQVFGILTASAPLPYLNDPEENKLFQELASSIGYALFLFQLKEEKDENEKKLNLLVKNSSDIIVLIDENGVQRFVSESAEKITGYKPEELTGKSLQEIIHPDDFQKVYQSWLKNIKTPGTMTIVRYRHIHKQKGWVHLEAAAQNFIEEKSIRAVVANVRDITQQICWEKKLHEKEQYYKTILDTAADGFWIINHLGRFEDVNESYCNMSGFSREELLTKTIEDIDFVENKNEIDSRIKKIIEKGMDTFETKHKRKDGTIFDVEVSVRFLNIDKGKFFCFCRDISLKKQTENQIIKQLNEKNLLLKEVHHRIKNNMSSIDSLLKTRYYEIENQEAQTVLRETISRIKTMSSLYDNLLISDNYQELSTNIYFKSLIQSVLSLFQHSKEIKIHKKIDDFLIDSKRAFTVGLIMNEILTNSMKYAFSNNNSGEMIIKLIKEKNMISLMIHDNGPGLPEKFEKNPHEGFGITLVKMLTHQLKGSYDFINQSGLCFILKFSL